jgi:hypothetical protein
VGSLEDLIGKKLNIAQWKQASLQDLHGGLDLVDTGTLTWFQGSRNALIAKKSKKEVFDDFN